MKTIVLAIAGLCLIVRPTLCLAASTKPVQKSGWTRITKEDFDLRKTLIANNEKEMLERSLPADLDENVNSEYVVASDSDDEPVELNDQIAAMDMNDDASHMEPTVVASIPKDHVFYAIDNDSSVDYTHFQTKRTQKFYGAQVRLHRHLFTNPILEDDHRDFRIFAGYLVHRVGVEPMDHKNKSFFTGVSYWVHFGHLGE